MELIPSCKRAIEKNWCLGCNVIEPPYNGMQNCKYSKPPTAQESINKIYKNLGVQERIKL